MLWKIATCDPGFTKPATRAGSVRLTEIAILSLGMVSADGADSASPPNLSEMICSPG